MRKLKLGFILVAVGLFFVSCTSFPTPDENAQTLVVGQIVSEASGFFNYGSATVNGINKDGIEIIIKNAESGKTYVMTSQKDGMFYSTDIPKGYYILTKLYYKKTTLFRWADLWFESLDEFEIVEGVVNNFGILDWTSVRAARFTLTANKEYEQVRARFEGRSQASNWNLREWKNVRLL